MLDGSSTSVYIEDNTIVEIGKKVEADTVIDGERKALLPGLVNAHTHAAMTLFRSYADDMELRDWLEGKIWPAERKLTPEDVYWGTKLACLEMIKSGTTCFNDMYFFMDSAAKAVEETGLRAVLSEGFIDLMDEDAGQESLKKTVAVTDRIASIKSPRIRPAWGPHAIYTVSEGSLGIFKELSDKTGYQIHMHLSETQTEVEDCRRMFGKRPVQYLSDIGFLGDGCVFAHGVWLDNDEIALLGKSDSKVVNNPVSNMKLTVGGTMPYKELRTAGVQLSLGTDGAASNNSLDMFQTLKFATLSHKFSTGDQTIASAREIWEVATHGGARSLGFKAGRVQEGWLADLILVDLMRPYMVPNHNLYSNLVYAASGDCVDTVICDGRLLMKGRVVKGEDEILQKAGLAAHNLLGRESDEAA